MALQSREQDPEGVPSRPRVAMLVLNPCHNDARVLRSARSLAERGATVRIFALGNTSYPSGVVRMDGFDVQRLEVRSWLVRVLGVSRQLYLVVRGTPDPALSAWFGRSLLRRGLLLAAVPILLLRLLAALQRWRKRAAGSQVETSLGSGRDRSQRPLAAAIENAALSVRRHILHSHVRVRIARWKARRQGVKLGRRLGRLCSWLLPAAISGPLVPPRLRRRRRASRLVRTWDRLVYRLARRRYLARHRFQRRVRALRRAWYLWRLPRRRAHARRARLRRAARARFAKRVKRWWRLRQLHARRARRRRRKLAKAVRARRRRWLRRRVILARATTRRRYRRLLRAAFLQGYRLLRRALLPLHRPTTIRHFWQQAEQQLLAWEPDVVHAHDLNTLVPACRVGVALDVPVIYDSHELWRRRNRHGQFRPLGRLSDVVLERRLAPRVDAVITVSPSIARWLENRYRLRQPVHVLRNTPLSRPAWDVPSDALGRRPGERVVAYSGRFTSGRGLEEMIEALRLLPSDVVLAAVGYGDGEYVESLLARARRAGVASRVRLCGPVPPSLVATALASADCALVAIQPTCLSYRYSLPNKLFEAVQGGVPVVASALPDIGALVTTYQIGATFPVGRPEELASAVRQVLEHGGRFRQNVEAARLRLCWEAEVETLFDCYRSVGVELQSGDGWEGNVPDAASAEPEARPSRSASAALQQVG